MDLRALRYFSYVADNRSFSKAALLLHVGQPTLSRSVQQLEQELGVRLLRRSSSGVEPTLPGRLLLRRAKDMLDHVSQIRDEVRAQADEITGTVSLSVPAGSGQLIVPAVMRHLHNQHPGIRLHILEGISAETYDRLLTQSTQIGLIYDPPAHRDLKSEPIAAEDMCLVGRVDRINALRATGGVGDLDGLPMILPKPPNSRRLLVEKVCKDHGLTLNLVAEVDSFMISRALLREGVGFTVATRSALSDLEPSGPLATVVLAPDSMCWVLSMVSHRSQAQNPVVQAVVESLRTVARDLIETGQWQGCRPPRGRNRSGCGKAQPAPVPADA